MNIGHVKQKILQEMGRKQDFSKIQFENEISKLWNMLDLEHFASKLFFQPPLKIFWCVLWQCWRYLEGALNLAECASKKIGVIRRIKRDIFGKMCRGGKTWVFFPPHFQDSSCFARRGTIRFGHMTYLWTTKRSN